MTIQECIQRLAGTATATLHLGTVTAVDGDTCTIQPRDGGAPVAGALLRPGADGSTAGIVAVPQPDSLVLWAWLEGSTTQAIVLMVAKPATLRMEVGDATLEMDGDTGEITLNGGANDGLVKVNPLVTQMQRLENKVNALISTFNTHTHTGVTTGGGVTGTTPAPQTPITPLTQKSDLENPDITH